MKKKLISLLMVILIVVTCSIPNEIQAASGLSAPQNVRISTNSNGNPTIKWNAVSGAKGYRLYRKTESDKSWVRVITLSKTNYTDTKWVADEGSTVQYCVKAYSRKNGKTTWSGKSSTKNWEVPITTISYTGTGDTVITDVNISENIYKISMSNIGSSNFIVTAYDESGKHVGLWANKIGNYNGETVGTNKISNGYIEVKSSGQWKIEISKIDESSSSTLIGNGSCVSGWFELEEKIFSVSMNNVGSYNFIVKIYDENGKLYPALVNKIGDYSGTAIFTGAKTGVKYCLSVISSGDWSIDFGLGDDTTELRSVQLIEKEEEILDNSDKSDNVNKPDNNNDKSDNSNKPNNNDDKSDDSNKPDNNNPNNNDNKADNNDDKSNNDYATTTYYGQVKGLVTYQYNKFIGTRGDNSAKVMLIPINDKVKNYDNSTAVMLINKRYDSGIIVTSCDGYGNFDFGDVPVGAYVALIVSNNTNSSMRFNDETKWNNYMNEIFSLFLSSEDLETLKLFMGYSKIYISVIEVEKGKCNKLSTDFDYTDF